MRTVNNKSLKHWTKKFFDVKKIADEPPLNKEGFWKKPEIKEIKIEHQDKKAG